MPQTKNLASLFSIVLMIMKTEQKPSDQDQEYYNHLVYIIIYLFFWSFLIDISIAIIVHFKHTKYYIANHSFINVCIVIGQCVNNIFLLRQFQNVTQYPLFYYEIAMLVLEFTQITFGFYLKSKLSSKFLTKEIFLFKNLHKFTGRGIYLFRKVILFYYFYNFLQANEVTYPEIYIVVMVVSLLILHVIVYVSVQGKPYDQDKEYMQYKADANINPEFQELLKQVQQNELNESLSEEGNLQNIQTEYSFKTESLISNSRDPKWVIIEDHVFQINDFNHPAGQYILNQINRKDVTREIYGLKSYWFENQDRSNFKILKHSHDNKTLRKISQFCIGPLKVKQDMIVNLHGNNAETSQISFDIHQMGQNVSFYQKQNIDKIHSWKIQQQIVIDAHQNSFLLLVNKKDREHMINLSVFWVDFFGKYFLVKDKEKNFMYPCLSLNPEYLHLKEQWLNEQNNPLCEYITKNKDKFNQDLIKIARNNKLVLTEREKQYMNKKQKQTLSFSLPLISYKKPLKSLFKDKEKFALKGPLGHGVGFNGQTTHHHLILIQDQGIVPFIDYLEFIEQKALIEQIGAQQTHSFFYQEYFYQYANEGLFWIYWEISKEYEETAKALALQKFKNISYIYTQSIKKDLVLLQKSIIVNHYQSIDGEYMETIPSELKSIEDVKRRLVSNERREEANRYILSGSDSFIQRMMKDTKEPLDHFFIVQFISQLFYQVAYLA